MKVRIKKSPKTGDQRDYSLTTHRPWSPTNTADPDATRNTIGAVPRQMANIEAEGGETVLGDINNDGNIEHMTITGKRHTQGGVPLQIPPGSFVFSDTNKMKIKDPNVLKHFGMGGKTGGYTPATIAKQYQLNDFMKKVNDPSTDALTRRTAEMMLNNNMQKLSELAAYQEGMKGKQPPAVSQQMLPDGGQQMSQTAQPVMMQDPAMMQQMMMQQQGQPEMDELEMAYGGRVLPKAQTGLSKGPDKSKGYWDRVTQGNMFQREDENDIDPRMQTALEKVIPFYGQDAEGFGDWFHTLFTMPQNEMNHLLTGYYESPMTTASRYNKYSGTQKFLGDVASDPMIIPEIPYAIGKAAYKGIAKGVKVTLPYAKQAAAITAKYGTKAMDALGHLIGKVPFEKLMTHAPTILSRLSQAAMHAPSDPITYERTRGATQGGKPITMGLRDGQWYNTANGQRITKFAPVAPNPNQFTLNAAPIVTHSNGTVAAVKKAPVKNVGSTPKVLPKKAPASQYIETGVEFETGGLVEYQTAGTVQPPADPKVKVVYDEKSGSYIVVDKNTGKDIFRTYQNAKDFTPTGNNSGYALQGATPQEKAKNLANWYTGWSSTLGIQPNEIKSVSDLQNRVYNYKLENEPEDLETMWTSQGLTSKGAGYQYDPVTKRMVVNGSGGQDLEKLRALGVNLTDKGQGASGNKKYALDFSKVDPAKRKEALGLLSNSYTDNIGGVRLLSTMPRVKAPVPVVPTPTTPTPAPVVAGPKTVYRCPDCLPVQVPGEYQMAAGDFESQARCQTECAPAKAIPGQKPAAPQDMWLQDKVSMGAIAGMDPYYGNPAMFQTNLMGANPQLEEYSAKNAAIQSNASMAASQINQSADPTAARANIAAIVGQSNQQGLNEIANIQNRNVNTTNDFAKFNAGIQNQENASNTQLRKQFFDETNVYGQNLQNFENQKEMQMANAFNRGVNGLQTRNMFRAIYPQYDVDPNSGAYRFNEGMDFTNSSVGYATSGASSQNMGELVSYYKKQLEGSVAPDKLDDAAIKFAEKHMASQQQNANIDHRAALRANPGMALSGMTGGYNPF